MQAPTLAGRATLLAAAGLLAMALFFGDGTSHGRLFWIGSLAVIAASVIALGDGIPVPRGPGLATLLLLAALAAWTGVTLWWSIAPDLSWAAFDRVLVYSAFALLGVLATRAPSGKSDGTTFPSSAQASTRPRRIARPAAAVRAGSGTRAASTPSRAYAE